MDKSKIVKPIYWTGRALKDLQKITVFNIELLGREKAAVISMEIYNTVLIFQNPDFDYVNIGAVDDAFPNLKRQYRKLIVGHYKVNYREGAAKILISRIFDTRQHPRKNK